MKTLILLLTPLIFCSIGYGQNKLLAYAAPGLSLYNSENSLKTIGDKSIGWFPGVGIAYEQENLWGVNWHFEYNYSRVKVEDVLDFAVSGPGGPQQIAYFGADLVLSTHNVDIALYHRLHEWVSIAVGPTVSLINRTLEIGGVPGLTPDFEDRLTSMGIGLNGSATIEIPFVASPPSFFFYSALTIRYLHAVWFDKKGRNLDNYDQDFLVGQLGLGVGYNF